MNTTSHDRESDRADSQADLSFYCSHISPGEFQQTSSSARISIFLLQTGIHVRISEPCCTTGIWCFSQWPVQNISLRNGWTPSSKPLAFDRGIVEDVHPFFRLVF